MEAAASAGWTLVSDASASDAANSVDVQIGPEDDMLQVASYTTKADVAHPEEWNMGATNTSTSDQVLLVTAGDVAHLSADITTNTQFATINWYLTPGVAVAP